MNDNRYVIFDLSEVDAIDFSEVMETSGETLRINVANTKSFVKYQGAQPLSVSALTTKSQEYSHAEIIDILSGEEWTNPNEEI